MILIFIVISNVFTWIILIIFQYCRFWWDCLHESIVHKFVYIHTGIGLYLQYSDWFATKQTKVQLKDLLKPLGTILPWCSSGFKESLNWDSTIPRDIEWDMIMVTDFLSILNQMVFHLVQNQRKTVTTIISHSMWKELEIVFSVYGTVFFFRGLLNVRPTQRLSFLKSLGNFSNDNACNGSRDLRFSAPCGTTSGPPETPPYITGTFLPRGLRGTPNYDPFTSLSEFSNGILILESFHVGIYGANKWFAGIGNAILASLATEKILLWHFQANLCPSREMTYF